MSQRSQKIVKSKEFLSSSDSDSSDSSDNAYVPQKSVHSSQKSSQHSLTQKSQNLVIDDRPKVKSPINKSPLNQKSLSDSSSSDSEEETVVKKKKNTPGKRAQPESDPESVKSEEVVEKPKKKKTKIKMTKELIYLFKSLVLKIHTGWSL